MDFVNDIIQNNSIVVFSKNHCYKCDILKNILKFENIQFYNCIVDELDEEQTFDIIDTLKTLTNFTQYPVCFINKEYISSIDEIKKICTMTKDVDINDI
jgi:glutaredoxin